VHDVIRQGSGPRFRKWYLAKKNTTDGQNSADEFLANALMAGARPRLKWNRLNFQNSVKGLIKIAYGQLRVLLLAIDIKVLAL
jgi:hypothetical protein